MKVPHPLLLPLLEKYDISWEQFIKLGRPPLGIRSKRSQIITDLHTSGLTWSEMVDVTGLSNGAIQRLTQAKGCAASREHLREGMLRASRMGVDKRRAKLSASMVERWRQGLFDFHKSRVRSPSEKQALKDGWTPEKRAVASASKKKSWATQDYRESLLKFHRSPEERARRSRAQSERMKLDPVKWARSKGRFVQASKCAAGDRFWVRSSYEAAAVSILEADPDVSSYEYEPYLDEVDGRLIKPDFVVVGLTGILLIEVKASWAIRLPVSHPVRMRLERARAAAAVRGWGFAIWTEKMEAMADAISRAK